MTSAPVVPAIKWVIPGGRPAKIVIYEEEMVSFFVEAAELLGVPKSVIRGWHGTSYNFTPD